VRLRTPRPFVVDPLIALAVTGVAMLVGHVSRAARGRPEPDGRAHVLIALAQLPVPLRGRWPLDRVRVGGGCGFLLEASGPERLLAAVAAVDAATRSSRPASPAA
jgi:hypothetical protein